MILPAGNKAISGRVNSSAFTLIELILVMAMLIVVLSVSWPSLAPFFRGRNLDSESKRFLALTRYGQSRAVSEGVPMVLWIDQEQNAYGLHADSTYLEADDREADYDVEKTVTMEVDLPKVTSTVKTAGQRRRPARGYSEIRFQPDGFMAESNPEWIAFRQSESSLVIIGLSRSRLYYEIQTNLPALLR